jgi:hypothetical protein
MWQQHCVLRNSSSGLSIYSSPLISAERLGGGQDIDGQCNTYRQSWLSFSTQPNLHNAEQVLGSLHEFCTIIFWLGMTYIAKFSIYGDTLTLFYLTLPHVTCLYLTLLHIASPDLPLLYFTSQCLTPTLTLFYFILPHLACPSNMLPHIASPDLL